MNRILLGAAFLTGAIAILWIGSGFIGTDALAFTVTLIIAAVYALGGAELFRYRQATATLSGALANIPAGISSLDSWLSAVHPTLQNPVRLRIEGERVALPGPVFTPYLVGLLVMLGLLGTFLGMVATLKGAVFALETTTDLQAIRTGLTAPIKGLGMAFGTSVAGVAASAMLGLMSTVSRRERLLATGVLDVKIATAFRSFSLVHNRQETFRALQFQAQALPDLVVRLQAMGEQMERMGQHLGETLLTNQQQFHQSAQTLYPGLATSVEKSLRDNLTESARLAGAVLQPVMADVMANLQRETLQTQQQLSAVMQEQWQHFNSTATALLADQARNDQQRLEAWTQRFEALSSTLAEQWQQAGAQVISRQEKTATALAATTQDMADTARQTSSRQLEQMEELLGASEELVRTRIASEQNWLATHSERMENLANVVRTELATLRAEEERRGNAAVERLSGLESAVAQHLATLGTALEEPMTRLLQTAAETPKAAAEVIAQLRREITSSIERDNSLLEERSRLMEQLHTLLAALETSSSGQQRAIEALTHSSADLLRQVGVEFAQRVDAETSNLANQVGQITGSATEVAGLSEAFGFAVELFSESSQKLTDNLARVEEALDKSSSRSDEQLAYYVAQAREIIDLSMLSQKEVFEELRRLGQQEQRALEREPEREPEREQEREPERESERDPEEVA